MNPFADLPTWLAVVVALLAAVVLVALNLGWLMAAKAMLDGQLKKSQERRASMPPPTTIEGEQTETDGRHGEPEGRQLDARGPSGRTPIV